MDPSEKITTLKKLDNAYQASETLNRRREEALFLIKKQFEEEKDALLSQIKTNQIDLGIRKSLNYHIEISDRITYVSRIGSNTIMVHRDRQFHLMNMSLISLMEL